MAVIINGDTGIDKITDGSVVADDLASTLDLSGKTITLPASVGGKILQVVSVYDRQQSSYTGLNINSGYTNYGLNEAGYDLTTLDIALTPSSTSSKILIQTCIALGADTNTFGVMRMKRGIGGATPTYSASDAWISANNSVAGSVSQAGSYCVTQLDGAWSTPMVTFQWLDSPNTTSEVKYRFNFRTEHDSSTTVYLNRAHYNVNDYGATACVSSVIAMEVAG